MDKKENLKQSDDFWAIDHAWCVWLYFHLVDEVPNVSRVGHDRSDGILGLGDDGTLIHSANARRFAHDVL